MIYGTTNYYFRFSDIFESRLDFVYYHPELDVLNNLQALTSFEVCSIDEILVPGDGITSGSTPKDITYSDEGIMFLGATNIQNGLLDLSSIVRIPDSYHRGILSSSQLLRDDVLVSMAGHYIGKCCVYDIDEEANINQALARLRVDRSIIIPDFLSLYLNSKFGQLGFRKYQHDVGQPNINLEEIKRIRIIKPNIPKQSEMLEKLKPLQIASRGLEADAKKDRKAAEIYFLQELGMKFDFSELSNYFFKTGYEKQTIWLYIYPEKLDDRLHYLFFHPRYSILDSLHDRCATASLSEICSDPIIRGEQPEYDEKGTFSVLKTVDLKNGYIDYDSALKVSEDFFYEHPSAHIRKGDILIASTGYVSMGKVDVYDRNEPAMVDGHVSVVRLNARYDTYFIAYFLRSHLGQLQFEKWFTGSSGQIELQPADLGKFIVPTNNDRGVPLREQRRISEIITEQLNKARDLEKQADAKWQEAKKKFEEMIFS